MNSTARHATRVNIGHQRILRCGVSMLAISMVTAPAYAQAADAAKAPTPNAISAPLLMAQAQTAQTESVSGSTNPQQTSNPGGGTIIVTGIRQILKTSQQIKRSSDT